MTYHFNQKELMFDFDCDKKMLQSNEEVYFSWFLYELMYYGYIDDITFQPKSFELSDKIGIDYIKIDKHGKKKKYKYTLDSGKRYTSDVKVLWNKKAKDIFHYCVEEHDYSRAVDLDISKMFISNKSSTNYFSYFEVKPIFDKHNMTRLVKHITSFVYSKTNIYINIVVPQKVFESMFYPQRFLFTDRALKMKKNIKNKVVFGDFIDRLLRNR